MNILALTLVLGVSSLGVGFLGALTGLGGGVVIVPLLVLAFGVDIRYAIGTSLVAAIATSSGAAAAYIKEGFTNLRIGIFMQVAAVAGALVGAVLAARVSPTFLAYAFAAVLFYSALNSFVRHRADAKVEPDPGALATRLHMDSTFPTPDGPQPYSVRAVPLGMLFMGGAGVLSGLLGIGAGAAKVLAFDQVMRLPFKVSTTTSNFMIGVTAAASASVFLHNGYIDPGLAMPVVLGVALGRCSARSSSSGPISPCFASFLVYLSWP